MSDETTSGEVREGSRIAKVMARAGLCSRRDAEAWIAAGRVTVNGEVLTSPACNVSEADEVRVDGERLAARERTRLFLFHKPRGLVTTSRDPEGRPTIFDALPPDLPRLVAVGRLDINTEGLLLLTNDGGLARVLELPSTGWLRRYRVRAHGSVEQAALDALRQGVTIDGVDYAGIDAKLDRTQGSNVWITMGLREGKNREIKKVLERLGLEVNRLIRVSFGPFELGDLSEGQIVEVRTRVLRDQLGAKLTRQAEADFDSPVVDHAPASTPEPKREPRGPRAHAEDRPRFGASARGARGAGERGPARHGPPPPSTPQRRRKHISALRAEMAADAAASEGPRKRVKREATQDRKGRTVTVERRSREHKDAQSPPGREARERGQRPDSFESKLARDGAGRERAGGAHRGEGRGSRGAIKPRSESRAGAGAARFHDDRKKGRFGEERREEKRHGDRPFRPRPPREDERRERAGPGPRSERAPRSDFKPRGQRDGAPRTRAFDRQEDRRRDESGKRPFRTSKSPSLGAPPGRRSGRGPGKPAGGGPRRPPRKS